MEIFEWPLRRSTLWSTSIPTVPAWEAIHLQNQSAFLGEVKLDVDKFQTYTLEPGAVAYSVCYQSSKLNSHADALSPCMKDIRQVVFFLLQVILGAGDTQGPIIQTPDQIYLDVQGCSLACQPLPSCCNFVQSWRIGYGLTRWNSVTYAGMLAGQSDCRNRCLWFMNPFDHGDKVENILLAALLLYTNFLTLLKM